MSISEEVNKLLMELKSVNYPRDMLAQHKKVLTQPNAFDLISSLLCQIMRYLQCRHFPVYASYLEKTGLNIETLADQYTVNIMYGTLRDLLKYQPRVAPESFTDKLNLADTKETNQIQYHRLRTLRIYVKLLRQLQALWIKISSNNMQRQQGFIVLLPASLKPQGYHLAKTWLENPNLFHNAPQQPEDQPQTDNENQYLENEEEQYQENPQRKPFIQQWNLPQAAPKPHGQPLCNNDQLIQLTKDCINGKSKESSVTFAALPKNVQKRIKDQFSLATTEKPKSKSKQKSTKKELESDEYYSEYDETPDNYSSESESEPEPAPSKKSNHSKKPSKYQIKSKNLRKSSKKSCKSESSEESYSSESESESQSEKYSSRRSKHLNKRSTLKQSDKQKNSSTSNHHSYSKNSNNDNYRTQQEKIQPQFSEQQNQNPEATFSNTTNAKQLNVFDGANHDQLAYNYLQQKPAMQANANDLTEREIMSRYQTIVDDTPDNYSSSAMAVKQEVLKSLHFNDDEIKRIVKTSYVPDAEQQRQQRIEDVVNQQVAQNENGGILGDADAEQLVNKYINGAAAEFGTNDPNQAQQQSIQPSPEYEQNVVSYQPQANNYTDPQNNDFDSQFANKLVQQPHIPATHDLSSTQPAYNQAVIPEIQALQSQSNFAGPALKQQYTAEKMLQPENIHTTFPEVVIPPVKQYSQLEPESPIQQQQILSQSQTTYPTNVPAAVEQQVSPIQNNGAVIPVSEAHNVYSEPSAASVAHNAPRQPSAAIGLDKEAIRKELEEMPIHQFEEAQPMSDGDKSVVVAPNPFQQPTKPSSVNEMSVSQTPATYNQTGVSNTPANYTTIHQNPNEQQTNELSHPSVDLEVFQSGAGQQEQISFISQAQPITASNVAKASLSATQQPDKIYERQDAQNTSQSAAQKRVNFSNLQDATPQSKQQKQQETDFKQQAYQPDSFDAKPSNNFSQSLTNEQKYTQQQATQQKYQDITQKQDFNQHSVPSYSNQLAINSMNAQKETASANQLNYEPIDEITQKYLPQEPQLPQSNTYANNSINSVDLAPNHPLQQQNITNYQQNSQQPQYSQVNAFQMVQPLVPVATHLQSSSSISSQVFSNTAPPLPPVASTSHSLYVPGQQQYFANALPKTSLTSTQLQSNSLLSTQLANKSKVAQIVDQVSQVLSESSKLLSDLGKTEDAIVQTAQLPQPSDDASFSATRSLANYKLNDLQNRGMMLLNQMNQIQMGFHDSEITPVPLQHRSSLESSSNSKK